MLLWREFWHVRSSSFHWRLNWFILHHSFWRQLWKMKFAYHFVFNFGFDTYFHLCRLIIFLDFNSLLCFGGAKLPESLFAVYNSMWKFRSNLKENMDCSLLSLWRNCKHDVSSYWSQRYLKISAISNTYFSNINFNSVHFQRISGPSLFQKQISTAKRIFTLNCHSQQN